MFEQVININYFIILGNNDVYSPMTGFSFNLIEQNIVLEKINYLPQNVFEISMDYPERISNRINRISEFSLIPIMLNSFKEIKTFPAVYNVCLCRSEFYKEVELFSNNWKFKPVVIDIDEEDLEIEDIISKVKKRFKYSLEKNDLYNEIISSPYRKEKQDFSKATSWNIQEEYETHGTTAFFYQYFNQLDFNFNNIKKISDINNDNVYYDNIIKWNKLFVKHINGFRKSIAAYIGKPDIVFTSYPMYNDQISIRIFKEFNNEDKLAIKKINKIFRILQTQHHYSLQIKNDNNIDFDLLTKMLSLRSEELKLYNNILALELNSDFCPIIRLKPAINNLKHEIVNLTLCSNKHSSKRKNWKKLQNRINESFKDKLIDFLEVTERLSVLVISDAPIEFAYVNPLTRLPIFLEYDLHKIPTTPGNVFFSIMMKRQYTELSYSKLCEVLIIRSFNEKDPLKYVLEKACNDFFLGLQKENNNIEILISYKIIDVDSISMLIETLNENKNEIVIFDCHGSDRLNREKNGWLLIGSEKFNIFEYKNKVKIPSIVILSSCETHPLNNNYASVANGFILAGAKSVLATNMRISAIDSSIFIARLLFRINYLVPNVLKYRKELPNMTWLEIVAGMQKMTFVSEVLQNYNIRKHLTERQYLDVHEKANQLINSYTDNWYVKFIDYLSRYMEFSQNNIFKIVSEDIGFTESMKYVLLGNADKILVNKFET